MLRSRSDLYVQVWRSRLVVENLRTRARAALEEGFGHPRLVIGDYRLAEGALQRAVVRVLDVAERAGRVLVHLQEPLEWGVTEVEIRTLRELGRAAGGEEVWLFRQPARLDRPDIEALIDGTAGPALMAARCA